MTHRSLTEEEIQTLQNRGCEAEDWTKVSVSDKGFVPERLARVRFMGSVKLGACNGTLAWHGVDWPTGLRDVTLVDCEVGDECVVERVGCLARVVLERDVLMQDVAVLDATSGASFANGHRIAVLNEGGGREMAIHHRLDAQMAWVQTTVRDDSPLQQACDKMLESVQRAWGERSAQVGAGTRICHCGSLHNVWIGSAAVLEGVGRLENGTILSEPVAVTHVGSGVWAKDFIIAEAARVHDGVSLKGAYVGQGVRLEHQYSAENCAFFANSELARGEGASVFAGPYTVSHHKATLMIAGMFSFYNAGSGTNQSNHHYKLGPIHQGILERGCKTASSSYLLGDYHVGAFSTIVGRHMTQVNTPDLPFSIIIERDGESALFPGQTLRSVGLARDGAKWPERDARPKGFRRDRITYEVFSPYTIEKIRQGVNELRGVRGREHSSKTGLMLRGLRVSPRSIDQGLDAYDAAIERYLLEPVVEALAAGESLATLWQDASALESPAAWCDVAGLICPVERVDAVRALVANGEIAEFDACQKAWDEVAANYLCDEMCYRRATFVAEYGMLPHELEDIRLKTLIERWERGATRWVVSLLTDAGKEFRPLAQIGYGLGRDEAARLADFEAVRGKRDEHPVVKQLEARMAHVESIAKQAFERLS